MPKMPSYFNNGGEKLNHTTVICIVPANLITQTKEAVSLQGFNQEINRYTVRYTSEPKLVLNFNHIPEKTTAILYLPQTAEDAYKNSAQELIKKLAHDKGFYIVTDQADISGLRVYQKKPSIQLELYLSAITKVSMPACLAAA